MSLILASSSPRRIDYLKLFGINFKAISPNIDESVKDHEDAFDYVKRMALQKAMSVFKDHQEDIILACDTIVICEDKILGKPGGIDEARAMIKLLSNKYHEVVSALCVLDKSQRYEHIERTKVHFVDIDDNIIEQYINTNEPYDKSGGYAIQSIGALFSDRIEGSISNIVGLPCSACMQLLAKFNIRANIKDL